MFLNRFVRIVALCSALACFGDETPGHSLHGEAFNEGPRQAAVLMAGMPKIDFPITTKSPDAQKFFTQGVAQQHGFWYFEAERSHRQASALDPEAAMPFWGMALANVNNEKRAKGFLAKAVERKAKASKREQLWINSLENFYKDDKRDKKQRQQDYIKDLEAIVQDFPEDIRGQGLPRLENLGCPQRLADQQQPSAGRAARSNLRRQPHAPGASLPHSFVG